MEEKTVALYNAHGELIPNVKATQQTPEFDPSFLQNPSSQFFRNQESTKQILEQPYKYYSWVYAAVSAISINLRRLTPYLFNVNDETGNQKPIKQHEILRLLRKPNPFMNGSEFMEAIILNLMLPTSRTPGGQCFLIPGDDRLNNFSFFKGNIPASLYPFSDAFVYPVITGGKLYGWSLRLPEQKEVIFDVDQVVRIKLQNPYNWLQGLSPYSAAILGVTNDAKAVALSNKFADNNANIGGILTTDKPMTKDQADDLTKRWNQQYAGIEKTGKTAVLYNGLKFEQTSKSLVDMQHIETRKLNREEVLAVYRIPKYAVSLYEDINYATSLAAKRTFWEETLIPVQDVIYDALNAEWIQNLDGRNLNAYADMSAVSALKEDYTAKIANAKSMIADGVPLAEAYRLNDIPINLKGMPWVNAPLVTGSRTNLNTGEIVGQSSMFGNLTEDDEDETDDKKKPAKEDDKEKPDDKEEDEKKGFNHIGLSQKIARIKLTVDEREKFWIQYVEKTLKNPEQKFNSMMKKYFIAQRNHMQDLVDEWAEKNSKDKSVIGLNRAFSIADLIPDKQLQDIALKEKAGPLYDAIVELQAAKMADEIGDPVNWTEGHPSVEKFKKLRIKQLKKINTHTFEVARDEISKIVNDGIAANQTVTEIAKNIKGIEKKIFDIRITNSNTIARTETASIASSTRFSIMDVEGINLHEWVSAKDESVRDTHSDEDGHIVEVGESFPSTGLLYPCFPGGEAKEVINCRCVSIAKKSK